MSISEKKLAAILALPGPERYSHFIKVVADREKVWALYDNGWALMATDHGVEVFPVWPEQEYAVLFAVGEWQHYSPREIPIQSFLDELLPKLRESGTLLGVFPTSGHKAVTPSLDEVERDIRMELSRFE